MAVKRLLFQTRIFPELPSELVLAESLLSSIRLSSLTCRLVSIDRHVTCITNQVLASSHDCVLEICNCDYLNISKILAGCTAQTPYCSQYRRILCPFWTLHCTKSFHHFSRGKYQCRCRFCVIDRPTNLRSLCVNRFHNMEYSLIPTT